MLEQWFADPAKVSATALMLAAIYALVRGRVITQGHHEQALKTQQQQYDAMVKNFEARIVELKSSHETHLSTCSAENKELKQRLFRQLDLTDRAMAALDKIMKKETA